jgi:hypothetical protein
MVRPSIAGPKWVALGPTALLGALVRFRIGESNEARSPAGCDKEAVGVAAVHIAVSRVAGRTSSAVLDRYRYRHSVGMTSSSAETKERNEL